MKISAPIITLLAGGALAGGLIVANSVTAGGTATSTAVQVADQGAAADESAKAAADEKAAKEKAAKDKAAAAGAAATPTAAAGGAAAQAGGEAQENVRRTYAGRVKGGGPLLAISVRDGVAVAYLCDGKLEAWFKGTAKDGRLTLTGKKGGELTGTFDAARAKGSVTVGKRQWDFQTRAVKKPSGLWKATAQVRGAQVEGGWVVLEDGTQVGLLLRNGVAAPAPRLDTAAGRVTVDGQVLPVVAADADTGAGF